MNILQKILQGVTNFTTTPPSAMGIDASPSQGPGFTQQSTDQPGITMGTGSPVVDPNDVPSDQLEPTGGPAVSGGNPRKPLGVLSAIGHLISPEPGSFESSMWQNGLVNARAGQEAYASAQAKERRGIVDEQAKTRENLASATQKEAQAKKERYITTPIGDVLDTQNLDANGQPTIIFRAPEKQSDNIQLIERYKNEPDPILKAAILQAIRGYNYSPAVIAAHTAATEAINESKAKDAKKYHVGGGRGGGAGTPNVPSGFHLVQ